MTMRAPYVSTILAGLFLLAALGAYAFWYAEVSERTAEAAQVSQELQAFGDAGSFASSLRRDLEELEQKESLVYSHFVGNDTIVAYLEGIEATGESLGAAVEVVSVANVQVKKDQPPAQLQMALRITGSFDAVMRTLGAIEYQGYDATLTALTLDTTGNGGWTAAATFLVGTPPPRP